MRTTTRQHLDFEDKIGSHKVRIEVVKNNIHDTYKLYLVLNVSQR